MKLNLELRGLTSRLEHVDSAYMKYKNDFLEQKKELETLRYQSLSRTEEGSPSKRRPIGADQEYAHNHEFSRVSGPDLSSSQKFIEELRKELQERMRQIEELQDKMRLLQTRFASTEKENYSLLNQNVQLRSIMERRSAVIEKLGRLSEEEDFNGENDSLDESHDLNEILEDLRAENEKLHYQNSQLQTQVQRVSEEFENYKQKYDVESKMLEVYGPVLVKNYAETERKKQSANELLMVEQNNSLEIAGKKTEK